MHTHDIRAKFTCNVTFEKSGSAKVFFSKPGYYHFELINDGKNITTYDSTSGRYAIVPETTSTADSLAEMGSAVFLLYNGKPDVLGETTFAMPYPRGYPGGGGDETIFMIGVPTEISVSHKVVSGDSVLVLTEAVNTGQVIFVKAYDINPQTNLPISIRYSIVSANGNQAVKSYEVFTSFKLLHAPLPASIFKFTPPPRAMRESIGVVEG